MTLGVLLLLIVASVGYYFIHARYIAVHVFLHEYNTRSQELENKVSLAEWDCTTNMTEYNELIRSEAAFELGRYNAEAYSQAKYFLDAHNRSEVWLSRDSRRQLSKVGQATLDGDELRQLNSVMERISSTYNRGEVCLDGGQTCMNLNTLGKQILSQSRNYTLLSEVWERWRDQVGKKIRPYVADLIKLKNKKARLNGYKDYGAQMRGMYEITDFEEVMHYLNHQLAPLYRLVHAYVRRKLQDNYEQFEDYPRDGLIPACVLGDMWGRMWTDIYDIVEPFPEAVSMDVTHLMLERHMTVLDMYNMTDMFYQSMGLKPLHDTFYEKSMLVQPEDGRRVVCHATAWDFHDGQDFRIQMCTNVTFKDLETVHHELGHIQYFMQYAHQPHVYRFGANAGFHEAVGELMGMVMGTERHLKSINLLPFTNSSKEEISINFLMRTALKTIVNIPFHYVNDLWRWQIFRGDVPQENWNSHYWYLKKKFLGVMPPVQRTEEHLDIFSIFHVANDFDMARYFTRTILQFQFAASLCSIAGHTGPLYDCDFSNSTEAGDKLAAMLSLGSSLPWPDVLERLTGTRHMDADPILAYFEPLKIYLEEWLAHNNETQGWPLEE